MISYNSTSISIGKHAARMIAPNRWELVLDMDLPVGSVPLDVWHKRMVSQTEALVRYMRAEGLIPKHNQHFNVIVSNENGA